MYRVEGSTHGDHKDQATSMTMGGRLGSARGGGPPQRRKLMTRHSVVVVSFAGLLSAVLAAYGTARAAGTTKSPEEELLAKVKGHPLAKLGPLLTNLNDEYQQFARSASGAQGRR